MASGFDRLVKRRLPPGYQHFLNESRSGAYQASSPPYFYHDGAVSPAGTGPFKRSKRSRGLPTNTRPTPGSAYRRNNPQYN